MRFETIAMPVLRAAAKRDWAMRLTDRLLDPWNPFSPQRPIDPYPLYEAMRAEWGPIGYQKRLRVWNVTGYAEVESVLRSPDTSVSRAEIIEAVSPYNKLKPETLDLIMSTMVMVDPPDHSRLRTLVNRAFTPRAIAELEPNVEKIARELLHQLDEQSTTDVMASFAHQLPIFVISDMLGFPESRWQEFRELSDVLAKFVDPINAFRPSEMEQAVTRFRSLVGEIIIERERQPQGDMLSQLLEAEDGGDRLSRAELESMVAILMVAGHETTAGFIGNSLLALDRNPGAREQLRAEPEIAANAVEELLRYDSPVQSTDRIATADIEIGGHAVRKGQILGVFLGAANRDPARYDQPDELILDRPDPRPMSFGHGIHYCLGAALARLEARIALPLFLDAFPDYQVAEQQVRWKRSVTLRGPQELPVKLR